MVWTASKVYKKRGHLYFFDGFAEMKKIGAKPEHPELAKATKLIRRDYCSMWYDIYYMCLP